MATNIEQEIIDWFISDYPYKNDYVGEGETPYFSSIFPAFYDAIYLTKYDKDSNTAILASGRAVIVDSYGGEGKGDEYWVVFHVGGKTYRVDGYYSSWEGANWESAEPYEVKPKEVTVIRYEKA